MKKIPQKNKIDSIFNNDFLPIKKKFTKSNFTLRIKEFYLLLEHAKTFREKDIFFLHNEGENITLFTKIKNKINGKKIKCLIKTKLNWFKVQLEQISENIIRLLFLKQIKSKKSLMKIEKLIKNISNLKINATDTSSINKYIFHYFEYHFKFNTISL